MQIKKDFDRSLLSFFTNPVWIIRKNLLKAIQKNVLYLYGKVLDFWCGEAPYEELVMSNKEVKEYIKLDRKSTWHNNVKNKIDVYWDWEKLPFQNKSFDCIFSTEVLEHVFNVDTVLQECNRILKKGGILFLTCPFAFPEHEQPYDFTRYTSFGLKYLLEKHWFEVVQYSKSWTAREANMQLLRLLLWEIFSSKFKMLNFISKIFVIAIGFILNTMSILPCKIDSLYLNNIILWKKL